LKKGGRRENGVLTRMTSSRRRPAGVAVVIGQQYC
jgi:hypothetical protein